MGVASWGLTLIRAAERAQSAPLRVMVWHPGDLRNWIPAWLVPAVTQKSLHTSVSLLCQTRRQQAP